MTERHNPYQSPRTASSNIVTTPVRVPLSLPLPPVCARCGAPSSGKRRIVLNTSFSELNWATNCPPILLPLCARHENFRCYWPRFGRWLMSGGTFMCFGIIMAAEEMDQSPVALYIAFACGAGMIGMFAGVAWLYFKSIPIRAVRALKLDIELVGVAQEFASACENMQNELANRKVGLLDNW